MGPADAAHPAAGTLQVEALNTDIACLAIHKVHPRRSGVCALWRRVVRVRQQVPGHASAVLTGWIAKVD
ncbi:hypothetical protein C4J84_4261 [Pseudomonas sp. R11-23-07]|nr:hypothetical protein C4J84_4261 [Pseudomonas sp. R11-23-07]